jgi:hypothetical protein
VSKYEGTRCVAFLSLPRESEPGLREVSDRRGGASASDLRAVSVVDEEEEDGMREDDVLGAGWVEDSPTIGNGAIVVCSCEGSRRGMGDTGSVAWGGSGPSEEDASTMYALVTGGAGGGAQGGVGVVELDAATSSKLARFTPGKGLGGITGTGASTCCCALGYQATTSFTAVFFWERGGNENVNANPEPADAVLLSP